MADPYMTQVAASLPDGHPLKATIGGQSPDEMARLREFATAPAPPTVFGTHSGPGMPPAPPPGISPAMASTPLPAAAFAAPPPTPVITMPEQIISSPAGPPPMPSPEHAAPPRPSLIPGGVSGARERPNKGPTQARLLGESYGELHKAADQVHDTQRTQNLHDAMAASVRIDDARRKEVEANEARRINADETAALEKDIHATTRDLANGPERTELSGGNKALAGIAIALGAFGAAYGGTGRNYAMEIIDKTIDRDVAQKRAVYEAKKSALGGKQDAFGRLVQKYGMSGAESMWKAASAERLAAEADQMAAQRGIGQADAQYQQTVGELNARAAREKAASIDYIHAGASGPSVWDPELGVPVPLKDWTTDAMLRRREREKAAAEGKDTVQGEVSELTKRREQAGIPKGQAGLSRAQEDLSKAPEIKKWKTFASDLVQGREWLPETVRQGAMSALYSKDEAAREQSHTMVVNKYINDVTGAGGGPAEMKRIEAAAGAAKTDPDARRRFYADMAEFYRAQDQNIRAGASPAARKRLDAALEAEAAPRFKEY